MLAIVSQALCQCWMCEARRRLILFSAAVTAGDGDGAAAHLSDTAQEAAEPQQSSAQPPSQTLEQAAAALPRFPMGLTYVGSRQAYAALATAMRMTGQLAVLAAAGCSIGVNAILRSRCSQPLALLPLMLPAVFRAAVVLLSPDTYLMRSQCLAADAPEVLRGMLEEALQRLRSGLERGTGDIGGWQVSRALRWQQRLASDVGRLRRTPLHNHAAMVRNRILLTCDVRTCDACRKAALRLPLWRLRCCMGRRQPGRDTSCLLGPARDTRADASPSGAADVASSPGTSDSGTGNSLQQQGAAAANGSAGVSLSRDAATAEVARCTELLLELLSDERLAGLPTHAEAAAAAAASRSRGPRRADGSAGGNTELAAHHWTPQVTPCELVEASTSKTMHFRMCRFDGDVSVRMEIVNTQDAFHQHLHD